MKKGFRKHLQKYCDISNWSKMHKPKKGKENYEIGKALAEDILRLLFYRENGYDGLAQILTALALARSYVKKAICWTPAFDTNSEVHLMDLYEDLFDGEWWMQLHDDRIRSQIESFIRGDLYPLRDELGINEV